MEGDEELIRQQIKILVEKLYELKFRDRSFNAGTDKLNYAGRVFDEKEMTSAVDSLLDFTLTHGNNCVKFEREFAKSLNSKFSVLTNSGSSANLIAVTSMK